MTPERIIELLRVGQCTSEAKRAECSTCAETERAVEAVRAVFAERDRLRAELAHIASVAELGHAWPYERVVRLIGESKGPGGGYVD